MGENNSEVAEIHTVSIVEIEKLVAYSDKQFLLPNGLRSVGEYRPEAFRRASDYSQ
jgi:hypothetical protein